jgi:glycosyltransferase involved in cell wall biosynthesis
MSVQPLVSSTALTRPSESPPVKARAGSVEPVRSATVTEVKPARTDRADMDTATRFDRELHEAMGTETRTISVVIPAMNEERNIAWVLERIPPYVDEVLLVDGYSVDDTVAVAQQVCPDIRIVPQRGCGKGAAMRTGFEAATSDYVVVLDADGSMDPAEIDYYVSALEEGYDLVKGSRDLPGGGSLDLTRLRRWGNRGLVSAVNLIWGSEFTDLCYGYLAFRRDRLRDLALTGRGFEIETEIVLNAIHAGLRIAEVPTVELLRHHGVSNLHAWRDGRRILGFITRARVQPRSRPVTDRIDRRALVARRWT